MINSTGSFTTIQRTIGIFLSILPEVIKRSRRSSEYSAIYHSVNVILDQLLLLLREEWNHSFINAEFPVARDGEDIRPPDDNT